MRHSILGYVFLVMCVSCYAQNYLDFLLDSAASWVHPVGTIPVFEVDQKKNNIPLFKKFPGLRKKLHHKKLGKFPTPLKRLAKFGKSVGISKLYIKDDSRLSTVFGGSQVRKFEFLLADVLANGAKSVITPGYPGSHHVLGLSIFAKKLGLKPIAMLDLKDFDKTGLKEKLMALAQYNPEIHCFPSDPVLRTAIVNKFLEHEDKFRVFPYYIPFGASTPLGCVGFVNAALELKEQIDATKIPEPDYIFMLAGSMGSAAGLIVGLKAAELKSEVVIVKIPPNVEQKSLYRLINQVFDLLVSLDKSLAGYLEKDTSFHWNGNFLPYDNEEKVKEVVALMDKLESIKLDTSVAGKVLAACVHYIIENDIKDKNVLFWNTHSYVDFSKYVKKTNYNRLPQMLKNLISFDIVDEKV